MIDTLEIRLHNCNKTIIDLNQPEGLRYVNPFNRGLYLKLMHDQNKYTEREIKQIDNNTIHYFENFHDNQFLRKSSQKIAFVNRPKVLKDSFDKIEQFYLPVRGSVQSSSSDYRFLFSYSDNADTLKFIFSVPKYIYGHSVAQFVPNTNSKRYQSNLLTIHQFKKQISFIKDRLIEIIYTIFTDLSYMYNLDMMTFDFRDLEVSRIDFCYNQHFYSKNMALDYLQNQKKIIKSRTKKNTKIIQDYDTSFAYRHASDGFYFKIYHKGSEFNKNDKESDFKRLLKHNKEYFNSNPQKMTLLRNIFKVHFNETFKKMSRKVKIENEFIELGCEDLIFEYYETYINNPTPETNKYISDLEEHFPFKLSHIFNYANKVLRYEMSFTRRYMSTLYKKHIFRKNDFHWKQLKDSFNKIKMYDNKLAICVKGANDFFRRNNITKEMRNEYKIYDKSIHKKHEFYLFTSKALKRHEIERTTSELLETNHKRVRQIKDHKEATLSYELLDLMATRFYNEIESFQVKELDENLTSIERIENYNKKVKQNQLQYEKVFGKGSIKKLTNKQKTDKGLISARVSRFKLILDALDTGKSIDQICSDLNLKRTAIYSLKKQLVKFDIHYNSIKTKFSFKHVRTDFKEYYEQFYINHRFKNQIFHNPFLISFDALRDGYHYDYNKNHQYSA